MEQNTHQETVLPLQLDDVLRQELASVGAELRLSEEALVGLAMQLGLQALCPAQQTVSPAVGQSRKVRRPARTDG